MARIVLQAESGWGNFGIHVTSDEPIEVVAISTYDDDDGNMADQLQELYAEAREEDDQCTIFRIGNEYFGWDHVFTPRLDKEFVDQVFEFNDMESQPIYEDICPEEDL